MILIKANYTLPVPFEHKFYDQTMQGGLEIFCSKGSPRLEKELYAIKERHVLE